MYELLDRREYQRMGCNIPVLMGGNYYPVGTALNISGGGCFVQTNIFMAINATINTAFELPYTLAKIKTNGKVIRYGKNPGEMAIFFYRIKENDLIILEQYIRDFRKNNR